MLLAATRASARKRAMAMFARAIAVVESCIGTIDLKQAAAKAPATPNATKTIKDICEGCVLC